MNRRKAIGRIILTGIGGGILFSGYKWYDWEKAPDWVYLEHSKELITALAETIIPATDSQITGGQASSLIPGAREAGVGEYIISMIRDCTDRMSTNKFINGLKELEHYCQTKFGKPYGQCSGTEQHSIMQFFEVQGKPFEGIVGKAQNRFLGQSFFTTLKKYSVNGYCSSEAGATRGLAYLYIPGSYHGCIPILPGQRAWATK